MLAKAKRLTRQGIVGLLKKSQIFHSPTFLLKVASAPNSKSNPKVAVTISSKIIKGAVGRNRLRRRSYAIFKKRYSSLKSGVIFQLLAKKPAATLTYQELDIRIKELLQKANLIQ